MKLAEIIQEFGQEHLLRFTDQLTPEQRERLYQELSQIDFSQLQRLTSGQGTTYDWAALASRAQLPPAIGLGREVQCIAGTDIARHDAVMAGEEALRAGRVGMILVAGGQGTRLGFDKPKGMFPVAPLSQRSLFQMHCDRLLAVMKRYATSIPLFVMTSPATDAPTREYFDAHERCGIPDDQLRIFCQGMMPAVDAKTGKVLMKSKGELALSPDGHGGLVAALDRSGSLREAKDRGVDLFYYVQVDNPLAELCDPEIIGYHLLSQSQMTSQVIRKRFAKEKVGNVVEVDGKVMIIEYSDLPDEAAEQVDSHGALKLWAGSIAIHVFDRTFLESVVTSADGLPFHRAHKPVPYIDDHGQRIEPTEANAIKFERFVFDLLPLARNPIVVEADPARVFAPVKNADGAPVDTPAHTKQAILSQHRGWLEAAGAEIASGVQIEIHPDWALDGEEVKSKLAPGTKFLADTYLR
jgi:UDP-N-acetylglucosamine/UDP-N-acetylgalactosamine diphosphorylase